MLSASKTNVRAVMINMSQIPLFHQHGTRSALVHVPKLELFRAFQPNIN